MPVIRGEPLQSATTVESDDGVRRPTLFVFLSSSCSGCHRVVDPVQELADDLADRLRTVIVIKSDVESALRFLSVFTIRLPVFHEGNLLWPGEDPIRLVPYWVLFAPEGHMVLQGVIDDQNGLSVLDALVRKEVATSLQPRANPIEFDPRPAQVGRH